MNWFGGVVLVFFFFFLLVVFLRLRTALEITGNIFSILTSMTAASMLDCTDRKPSYQARGTLHSEK